MKVSHWMIVEGDGFSACEHRVRRFFARTDLVHYETIEISQQEALRGDSPDFIHQLDQAISANRGVVKTLLAELAAEGVRGFADLHTLEQGVASKLFHTVAHLVDGFFGIDTVCYNLEEDSHWVSAAMHERIAADPASFWLLKIRAGVGGGILAPISGMRTFENKLS